MTVAQDDGGKDLIAGKVFLEKKSDQSTTDHGQRIVSATVSADKKFLAVSIHRIPSVNTVIRGQDERKVTMRPSSLLFNLETGDVVKQYKNANLSFSENTLKLIRYDDDLWGKTFQASKYNDVISENMTRKYLDPVTFKEKSGPDKKLGFPEGHELGSQEGEFITTQKRGGSNTYLWKKTSGDLNLVAKLPVTKARLSADGTLISGSSDEGIEIYDTQSGNRIKSVKKERNSQPQLTFITRNKQLVYSYVSVDAKTMAISASVRVIDLQTEKELAHFPNAGIRFEVNDAGNTMLTHSMLTGEIQLIDMSDFSVINREAFAVVSRENPFSQISSINKVGDDHFLIANPSGIMNLVSLKEKQIIADIYVDQEDWAVVAKDGRVDGTQGALDKLEWREYNSSGRVVTRTSLDAAFDNFFTPHLLPALLRNETGDVSELKEQMAKTPSVEIINPSNGTKTSKHEITVTAKATAKGDPIKEIRLFVNGKLVSGDQRGLKLASGENEKTFTISLTSGRNVISARAVSQNGYESSRTSIEVDYTGRQLTASNLYILAIGIDQYKNNSYNLNYATTDAEALVQEIQDRAGSIFDDMRVNYIADDEATKGKIQQTINSIQKQARPQDMFVFYYAGHGVMSNGSSTNPSDFHLALHDVTQLYGSDQMLADRGISAAELRETFGDIEARKQLIVLDACQSGGAVETFAQRGAAEEKAMIQLARSTGITLLASTGTEQFATEFEELGHGVFTYSILEGLSGKADGGSEDGKITVKELEAWLNDAVPRFTREYKGTTQYPRSWSQGMDFPVGVVNE